MLVLKNDGRRREKLGFGRVWVGHGRATTGTGCAKLLVFWVGWQGMGWHGRATAGTGRAKLMASQAQKKNFSVFSNRSRTITYKIT